MSKMNDVKIFQNYLSDDEKSELDPSFIPHDWRHNPSPELREISIFLDFYESNRYRESEYAGLFSKKFATKTKINGEQFIDFIRANPGYDVYFINPYPQNAYYTYNIWQQGEFFHPGIIAAAQTLLDKANIPIKIQDAGRQDRNTLLYCNFWVGNSTFWKKYMEFLKPILNYVNGEMPAKEKNLYFRLRPYVDLVTDELSSCAMFPFIIERLFSTYIQHESKIKYLAYQHNEDEIRRTCLSDMEYRIYLAFRNLIDQWDGERNTDQMMYKNTFAGLLKLAWQSVERLVEAV